MTPARARSVLGLPKSGAITPQQITTAYRTAARRTHPDTGGTAEAFRECLVASELLRRELEAKQEPSQSWTAADDERRRRFTATDFKFEAGDFMDQMRRARAAAQAAAAQEAHRAADGMFDADSIRDQLAGVKWGRGPQIINVPCNASVYILDGNLCLRHAGITLTVTPEGAGTITAGDT